MILKRRDDQVDRRRRQASRGLGPVLGAGQLVQVVLFGEVLWIVRQVGNVHHRVDSERREVAGCRDTVDSGTTRAAKNDNCRYLVAIFRV